MNDQSQLHEVVAELRMMSVLPNVSIDLSEAFCLLSEGVDVIEFGRLEPILEEKCELSERFVKAVEWIYWRKTDLVGRRKLHMQSIDFPWWQFCGSYGDAVALVADFLESESG